MNSERDKAAEEYADRIMNTLEDADARARSFKAGWDAALKSSVVMGLVNLSKHPDFEELSCECGYYGEDTEETGMSICFKCAIAEALSLYRDTVGDE
jgi:hypothetical protein